MCTTIHVLRIFDYSKVIEFYINWLEFKVDWEDKSNELPIYIQISLNNIILHLSENHGDSCPGSKVFIQNFKDLKSYHKKLIDKNYKYNKPGLEVPFYNNKAIEMEVIDPFGNKIIFNENITN